MASTTSPLAPELLALLRCPETMQTVSLAPPEVIARVNQQGLPSCSGEQSPAPLEAGLLRADGARLFPIRAGIPLMLPGEAIDLL